MDEIHKRRYKHGCTIAEGESCPEMRHVIREINQVLSRIKDPETNRFAAEVPGFRSEDSERENKKKLPADTKECLPDFQAFCNRGLPDRAVKKLSKEERLVLSLYYCDELNIEEIGEVMGMRPFMVARLFKRAMLGLLSRIK